ncbi:iron-siderophore ABC transporter substrate-binding protein [Promicromonospora sukumoe]|uniref:Iron complex transport system substrate-binding protein n=1 Tax=Promicromonospora sukumoe TaxID=88382 RepID=A0A7W3JAQ1_9MICO|nr:iron-siderophore ABC transporter substrate-binding protein [Promicromonospora sukumoe]MBA8809319.1 iron complex transport system substrate-binding protein [Promicromonospora sukumoe]MBA8809339.1 iron complex transport system substrate-binding protein [Promicromonospora sukumoe]MBA8809350.1 iron complex transport system substrate-binding protein [Promicromonospora sukumoe]
MRPPRLLAATLVVPVLALAACSAETAPPSAEGSAAAGGAFPVTVETKFEPVTIDEQPERVVALGWGDAEVALELGVQPVGASDWLAFGGDGVGPWSEGYDEAPEILGTLELSYEAVAALEPDLILDTHSSGDQERYDRLSSIAPTVGVPEGGDSYHTDYDVQVTMIAQALGVPEEGDALLGGVDEAFEQAAADHPEWAGTTFTAATRTSEGWGAYVNDGRSLFMERLGFEASPTITDLPVEENGWSVRISEEQLDLLDSDLIVAFPIWIDAKEITDDAGWKQIPAVADGRAVVIGDDLSAAYSLGTPAAQLYALDELTPLIEDALS